MNQTNTQKSQDFIADVDSHESVITTEVASVSSDRMKKYAEAFKKGDK